MRFLEDGRLYTDTDRCLAHLRSMRRDTKTLGEPWTTHLYWRGPLGRKPAFAIKSFLATQDPATTRLWLWLDDDEQQTAHERHPTVAPLLPYLTVRRFDPVRETIGTPLDDRPDLFRGLPAVRRSNLVRFVVLFKYGGLYADMDTLFLRDLAPLFQDSRFPAEFCYRWSAHRPYGNSAMLALGRGSPTAQALLMRCRRAGSCRPRDVLRFDDTPDLDLMVLPCAFFDPLWPRHDRSDLGSEAPFDRFGDFFRRFGWRHPRPAPAPSLASFFPGAFTFHWHNQWDAREHDESFFGVFDRELDRMLEARRGLRTVAEDR
jgi:hypothetical protein